MSALRWNVAGVVVLVVGLGCAIPLYRQNRSPVFAPNGEWRDTTFALTESKANTRNIEMFGGKLEVLMVKWQEWFRDADTRAMVIGTISVLIALGCFLTARCSAVSSQQTGEREL